MSIYDDIYKDGGIDDDFNYVQPGLRVRNLHLKRVYYDPEGTNKPIIFEFVQAGTKAIFNHREFEPSKREDATEEEFKKSARLTLKRVAHIIGRYVDEAKLKKIVVSSWEDFVKQHIAALPEPEVYQKFKADAKITYRYDKNKDRYYTQFPKVTPFISTPQFPTIDHSDPNAKFSYDPTWDVLTKPSQTPDAPGAGMGGNVPQGNVPPPPPPAAGDPDDLPF